jgi:hypothetical protein
VYKLFNKTYAIGAWSAPCGVSYGHPVNSLTIVRERVGIKNDTYVATCECGATQRRFSYAKRK